jgi:capsular exopolysaccharide synthesis family protein
MGESISAEQMVHSLARFFLAIRYRRNLLLAAVVASLTIGLLYLFLATRYYGATAQVLVIEADYERGTPNFASEDRWQRTLMPTHRSILRSSAVVAKAVGKIDPVHRVDLVGQPRERWVERIQKNLSVSALQNTNILEIHYRSKEPRAAVAVVDAILDAYMEFIEETYQGAAKEILTLLTREKSQLEERLAEKETQLLALRQEAADLGYQTEGRMTHPLVQRAIDLNSKLMEARTRRISLEVAAQQLQLAIQTGADLHQHLLGISELIGQDLIRQRLGLDAPDTYLQARMYQTLLEDQARLENLVTQRGYGWAHPEVLALQEKIRRTQEFLQNYPQWIRRRTEAIGYSEFASTLSDILLQKVNEARSLELSLSQQYEEAQREAVALTGTLARIDILAREVEWLRNLRQALLQRITDIDLQQKGREVRAFVISEPKINPSPVSPNWRFVLLGALAAGLALGLTLVYVVDILDDRFRSMEELQLLTGTPVLATVRDLSVPEDGGLESLPAYANPNSAESEAFRTLRTALALAETETNLLVVTSAQPSEGKTTVLANLAVATARAGKRTLLIDADLRKPRLTALLKMRGREGLAAVIQSAGDLETVARANIRRTTLECLDVLPCGPRPANPAELLSSQRFSELLAWAESAYDQVFIDSPPALATSDAALIGRITGAVLLVVQPAKSTRRMVLRTIEQFQLLRIPVVGIVLNRVGSKEADYYGYGYYGYEYEDPDASADEESQQALADEEAKEGVSAPNVAAEETAGKLRQEERRHSAAEIVPSNLRKVRRVA